MSKIDDLIAQHCPDGVTYRKLAELGTFYGGLTGKTKSDFYDGAGSYFVPYTNVYNNLAVDLDALSPVSVKDGEKQNRVAYGDVLITGSSETSEDCGMSSVVTSKLVDAVYLNSFCFGFRPNDLSLFDAGYLKYIFRSSAVRKQIIQTANGVTRFNISKKLFGRIEIPVPPLPVQEEIVRILDSFSSLEAELEARRKQYAHYRDELLNFNASENAGGGYALIASLLAQHCPNGVEYQRLESCCTILDRKRKPVTKAAREVGQYPYYGANGVQDYVADYIFDGTFVLVGEDGSVITAAGTPVVTWATGKIWVNNHAHIIEGKGDVLLRYLYHYLQIVNVAPLIHGNIPKLTGGDFKAIRIPVPPLPVQEEIVAILDRFDKLTNDLSSGLPAEIEARRKQYEYYRDRLLSFNNLAA